jgi:hypothetical protein
MLLRPARVLLRYGIKMADYVPMTVTNRAYTSPVWYSP